MLRYVSYIGVVCHLSPAHFIIQVPSDQASGSDEVQQLREKLKSTESYCTQLESELEKLKIEEPEKVGQGEQQRLEMSHKTEELGKVLEEAAKREAVLQKDLQESIDNEQEMLKLLEEMHKEKSMALENYQKEHLARSLASEKVSTVFRIRAPLVSHANTN